jgi:hypothetical protein
MNYVKNPPSEPGYYWLKRDEAEEVVEIWTDPNNPGKERIYYVHHCGSGSAVDVGKMEGAQWAGPIPKPLG